MAHPKLNGTKPSIGVTHYICKTLEKSLFSASKTLQCGVVSGAFLPPEYCVPQLEPHNTFHWSNKKKIYIYINTTVFLEAKSVYILINIFTGFSTCHSLLYYSPFSTLPYSSLLYSNSILPYSTLYSLLSTLLFSSVLYPTFPYSTFCSSISSILYATLLCYSVKCAWVSYVDQGALQVKAMLGHVTHTSQNACHSSK